MPLTIIDTSIMGRNLPQEEAYPKVYWKWDLLIPNYVVDPVTHSSPHPAPLFPRSAGFGKAFLGVLALLPQISFVPDHNLPLSDCPPVPLNPLLIPISMAPFYLCP